MTWLTIDCERALYVDRGRETILCDRLSSPVTLVVKLASGMSAFGRDRETGHEAKPASPTAATSGGDAQHEDTP